MLGSVTDRVMRKAICPVMAVRERPRDLAASGQEQHYTHRLDRIVACMDFSEYSERALRNAISGAVEYHAELTLLHVLEEVSSPAKTERARAEATERLDKLIPPERNKSLKVKMAVRTGKPYQENHSIRPGNANRLDNDGGARPGRLGYCDFGSTTYRVM